MFINDVLQYEDTSPDLCWVGNGRVIQDNKGNVIKAYEPYYSSTPTTRTRWSSSSRASLP